MSYGPDTIFNHKCSVTLTFGPQNQSDTSLTHGEQEYAMQMREQDVYKKCIWKARELSKRLLKLLSVHANYIGPSVMTDHAN